MNFPQFVFIVLYLGTPVFLAYRWIRIGLREGRVMVGLLAAALGLWLLQAGVTAFAILSCIGGHCHASDFEQTMLGAFIVGAYAAIAFLLWLSRRR